MQYTGFDQPLSDFLNRSTAAETHFLEELLGQLDSFAQMFEFFELALCGGSSLGT